MGTSLLVDVDALAVVALHMHLVDGHIAHRAPQAVFDVVARTGGAGGDVTAWHEHGLDLVVGRGVL